MDPTQAHWRKSSRSAGDQDNCVEVAVLDGVVAVRDSKDPDGPVHLLDREGFHQLSIELKNA